MTSKQWNEYAKPVVVLVVICIVTSLLLALTNQLTAPVIEANERKVAQAAYYEVMPAATNFVQVEGIDNADVLDVQKDEGGAGIVMKVQGQGFGGKVPCVVAFDMEGTIVGVKFLENSETKGYGSRLYEDTSFAAQFAGMPAENFTISDIDALSGATISSKAAVEALNTAIDTYNQLKEGM